MDLPLDKQIVPNDMIKLYIIALRIEEKLLFDVEFQTPYIRPGSMLRLISHRSEGTANLLFFSK